LQSVENAGGASGVDAVADEGGDDEGDGDLDGFGIFEGREVKLDFRRDLGGLQVGLGGFGRGLGEIVVVFDQISVAAVQARVEVAVGCLAKRWGFAAAAVGFDMAAESLGHGLAPFSGVPPPPCQTGYFAGKFIVCNRLETRLVAKILNTGGLAAKYRQA
jgi:hypothetical protein